MKNLPTKEIKMTVKEVAWVLGVSEKHVLITINKIYPGLVKNGIKTYLDEEEITSIKMTMEKNPYLDQSVKVKTNLEKKMIIKQAIEFLNEEVADLKKENTSLKATVAINAPKAEFYDTVTGSKDTIDIGQVAKLLDKKIGRNKLFQILRNKKIIDRQNIPYQKFIDSGYFRIIESKFVKPNGTRHINLKTVVYQKGVDYINKILEGIKEIK